MYYVKWVIYLVIFAVVAAFLHYTLPQNDIVRITDTYARRMDVGENPMFWARGDAGTATGQANREVFFIQSVNRDGNPRVYRNEDTGWGWPPYFKFNNSNLQTEATDLKSTREAPTWVQVTHYGWRFELWTIFPNAISVKAVDNPDKRIIPWLNIVILLVLFAVFWAIRVRVLRFWNRRFGD